MLALVGSGEYLSDMDAVDRALLRRVEAALGEPARVVCLPTASATEGEATIERWSRMGVEHFARLGAQVETVRIVDRASANEASMTAAVERANFVYLSGGKPSYLYETLHDSLAWAAIQSVMKRGGLLAGCSAGAMVQGGQMLNFPNFNSGSPAFGLVPDTLVVPHYDQIPEVMLHPLRFFLDADLTVLGIEANTALFVNGAVDTGDEVIGSGGVTVWTKQDKTRYTAGPLPEHAL